MRSRLVLVWVCAFSCVVAAACVPQATGEEIESMCNNLVDLRGEISKPASSEMITSDISVKFEQRTKALQDEQMQAQKVLNEEMQAKLEGAVNDAERSQIREEYAEKIDELKSRLAPEMASIKTKREEAITDAKEQAEENRSAWNAAVEECANLAREEGVTQKVARCRIDAQTTDKYWNGCR